jgi:hypothetical protein
MRRILWTAWFGLVLALLPGCATGQLFDGSMPFGVSGEPEMNPVYVPPGPISYLDKDGRTGVFEHTVRVLTDFGFEILDANMFEGKIETLPRIVPGILQPLKPGNADTYQRVLSTFQSYRHRVVVKIEPAQQTGYFIFVTVYKELEDLPRPVRATAGAANFRVDNNVQRQFTVIDPTIFESNWIPKGRDAEVEQVLLQRLKCMQ